VSAVRLTLVAATWLVIVGGLWLYTGHRRAAPGAAAARPGAAEGVGRFQVRLTPTFVPAPDPFGLRGPDGAPPPALLVRLAGREMLPAVAEAEPGEALVVDLPEGALSAGPNELYVEASPPVSPPGRSHALRVEVLRDAVPIAEGTFWSAGGSKVAGTLRLAVPALPEGGGDGR
jgi:hypothetical protein